MRVEPYQNLQGGTRSGVATRDTATEIRDTAEGSQRQPCRADTARGVEETVTTAGQTGQAVQDTARQVPKAALKTIKSARKGEGR